MTAVNWSAIDQRIALRRQQVRRSLLPKSIRIMTGAPDDFQLGIPRNWNVAPYGRDAAESVRPPTRPSPDW